MNNIATYQAVVRFLIKYKNYIIIISYSKKTKYFTIFYIKKNSKISFGNTTIIRYESCYILELLLNELESLKIMYSKSIENDAPLILKTKKNSKGSVRGSIIKEKDLTEIEETLEHHFTYNNQELYKLFMDEIKDYFDLELYDYIANELNKLVFTSYLYKDPDYVNVDCTHNCKDIMVRKGEIIKSLFNIIYRIRF